MRQVVHEETVLAIIVSADFSRKGIQFFTPDSFSQQLGYMQHPKGHVIVPHDHNPVQRTVEWTQEVLFIKSGTVRLDLYVPDSRAYLQSHILGGGDVVLLAHGGHGLVMLEDAEIIEVKQGPYVGEADKARFAAVADVAVIYPEEERNG